MNLGKNFTEWTCFKICFKNAPLMTIYTILNTLILCVIPFVKIIATAKFIDAAVVLVTDKTSIKTVILPIILVVVAMGYMYLERSVIAIVWIKIEAKLRTEYSVMQIKKIASLKYEHIENPKTLNLIRRTNKDSEDAISGVCKTILGAICLFADISCIFIIIMSVSVPTSLLLMIIAVPLFFISMKAGKIRHNALKEVTEYQRHFEYLNDVLSNRDAVEERSLFEYHPSVEKKWHTYYEEFRKRDILATFKGNLYLEGGSIITSLFAIIIAAFLLVLYYNGTMTIGLLLSIVTAVISLIETMSWSFSGTISELTNNHLYLKEVDTFFKLSEEDGALHEIDDTIAINSIEFKNVRFKYPNTDYYVLDGISLKLEKGRHYAFVGANGTGKTTIIKLLTGLYRDYEGSIFLNDKELREYPLNTLKSLFSTVYQDFARYQVSLKDNIRFGDMRCTEADINSAVKSSGLQKVLARMDINTPLGKILEGGQDLSGGEWQRIAIARALIKNSSMLILDEPTAALDPIMENKIYEEFGRISQNQTTIFVSHRLGSTKLAEIIFVIGSGKVLECGTHSNLVLHGGIYNEMYTSQKRWYE